MGGGINAPGMSPGNGVGAQNAATAAINQMLTNPNAAAGANGLGTAGGMTTGGIAGVASNYKGTSIKIYKTRQKYQEWEFIFSLNNQQNGAGQNRNPLQPGQNGLTPGQNGQPGQPPEWGSLGSNRLGRLRGLLRVLRGNPGIGTLGETRFLGRGEKWGQPALSTRRSSIALRLDVDALGQSRQSPLFARCIVPS